jgi:hypothetical protein
MALTVVWEFHRLSDRWRREGVLTISEARRLSRLKRRFEPGPPDEERPRLVIVDRRPVIVAARGRLARGELIAFALRAAVMRVTAPIEPGDQVKVAIPRRPDGRWHRFLARAIGTDRRRRRVTVEFLSPVGDSRRQPVP